MVVELGTGLKEVAGFTFDIRFPISAVPE